MNRLGGWQLIVSSMVGHAEDIKASVDINECIDSRDLEHHRPMFCGGWWRKRKSLLALTLMGQTY